MKLVSFTHKTASTHIIKKFKIALLACFIQLFRFHLNFRAKTDIFWILFSNSKYPIDSKISRGFY